MMPRKQWILGLDLVLALVALTGIWLTANRADIGGQFGMVKGRLTVRRLPATPHLFPNDVLLQLDGSDAWNTNDLEFLLHRKSIGDSVRVKVQRDTLIRTYRISVTPNPNSVAPKENIEVEYYRESVSRFIALRLVPKYSVLELIGLALLAATFFALALFVYHKQPTDRAAQLFHWTSLCAALVLCTASIKFSLSPTHVSYWLYALSLALTVITPMLFVHFTQVFPNRARRTAWLLWTLWGVAACLAGYTVYTFSVAVKFASWEEIDAFLSAVNASRLFFAAMMTLGIAGFVRSYMDAAEESERRKLRWTLLGVFISASGFLFLWLLPKVFLGATLLGVLGVTGESIVFGLWVVAPVTFAISIIRYRLLDIDILFNRSTVYAATLSAVIVVYVSIVALAANLVGGLTERAAVFSSTLAAMLIALLFEPVRKRVQHLVDKKFFRVQYNLRAELRTLNDGMNHAIDDISLAEFALHHLNRILKPQRLVVLYAEQSKLVVRSEKHAPIFLGKSVPLSPNRAKDSLNPRPAAAPNTVEQGVACQMLDKKITARFAFVVAVPIVSETTCFGFMLIGKKKSDMLFSAEDVELLQSVAAQMAQTLARLKLQRDLVLQAEESKRLRELSEMKSHFVSSVSHDLRTPLTSIKMFAEILAAEPTLNANQKKFLTIIEGESDRLTKLVSNILSYAKSERGLMPHQFETHDLSELIKNALQNLKYQLDFQGFTVDLHLPQMPVFIKADKATFEQTIENLISNAMKYSGTSREIHVAAQETETTAMLEVKDYGIGLSEADKARIFEPFFRASSEASRQVGGAGLGLAIVQSTVRVHGGSIEVESEPAKGSVFRIRLPKQAV
jgi:signal transduction histidine kinase